MTDSPSKKLHVYETFTKAILKPNRFSLLQSGCNSTKNLSMTCRQLAAAQPHAAAEKLDRHAMAPSAG